MTGKVGELFVVLFENIQFQDITTEAIGIFKIEKKIDYLKFQLAEDDLDFMISKGVKLQKIDKDCLILNTEKTDGFRVISVDNNNYDANYWKKGFLNIEEVMNDSYQTKHHLQLLTTFSNVFNTIKKLPPVLYEIDLFKTLKLNKGVIFFFFLTPQDKNFELFLKQIESLR